jgi:hypothetical protein
MAIETQVGQYQPKVYLAELAKKNYYNPFDQIIRVDFNGRIIDFRLGGNVIEVPNPEKHVVLIVAPEEVMDKINNSQINEDLLPGYVDANFTPAEIPIGAAFLIHKGFVVSGTNPQNGSAGFAMDNTNMFDLNKVRISISPSIEKPYTNNDLNEAQGQNIGVFMNDNTVLVKSRGASLTLGEDGVHIGGKVFWESSKHNKEWIVDNPFAGFVPETIITFPVSIPYIPNIGAITNMANAGRKVINVIGKGTAIADALV